MTEQFDLGCGDHSKLTLSEGRRVRHPRGGMGLTPAEQLFLGIGISILGSTISNLGQNAQKYAQVMNDALPPAERQASYTSL